MDSRINGLDEVFYKFEKFRYNYVRFLLIKYLLNSTQENAVFMNIYMGPYM